ncbi:ribose 5-phosphate isomerase A-domain-containing protein [Coniochaeta sp. 2T2.1]|nr:ribose 5-phosphate isomerase A-domain-containing protein [Coniochaeta sp. 2T2.1]
MTSFIRTSSLLPSSSRRLTSLFARFPVASLSSSPSLLHSQSQTTLAINCHTINTTPANWNRSYKTASTLSGRQTLDFNIRRCKPLKTFPQTQHANMSTSQSTLTVEQQAALVESSKKAAAFQAVKDHLEPTFLHVGIGSGSTVVYVVEAIAKLGSGVTSKMTFYPTGEQSRQLILTAGLRLAYIQDLPSDAFLDVAFDGADEVDEDLNLIKGGGACLMQEKIVATSAKKFVCVADFRKISPRLGTSWKKGIPIEVLPMAADRVLGELKAMGSINPRVRSGLPGKAGPIVTDNGMLIIDAPFAPLLLPKDAQSGIMGGNGDDGIWTVDALAQRLISIVGVAEIGLFHGKNGLEIASGAQKPVAAYFGLEDGGVKVTKAGEASS